MTGRAAAGGYPIRRSAWPGRDQLAPRPVKGRAPAWLPKVTFVARLCVHMRIVCARVNERRGGSV